MKILTNYDFNQNEIQNVAIQRLATAPTNPAPVKGQMFFNTTSNRLYYYNGAEWVGADAVGATMTGDNIIDAINISAKTIDDDNLSASVNSAIAAMHTTHAISDVTGLQTALDGKVDDSQVLTNVPANAVFTDTVYTHPTTPGNKHIPTGGSANQILRYSASGTAVWSNEVDTVYTHPTGDGNLHVPATSTTNNGKVLKAGATAGSLVWADDNDTTYSVFTSSVNGLTPSSGGGTTKYLRADGTWVIPPNTIYTLPVAGASLGGVKSGTDITVDASGNVAVNDDSHNHVISNIDGLQDALDALPTAAEAQGYATTAEGNANSYTDTAISNLVSSAPGTLDTLNELAAALGDDPNFATTVTNNLAAKTDKYTTTVGDGTSTSYVITHNLNSRDIVIMLRESASPYAQVITDVEMTTVNTITLKFAVAPTAGQYTVTVIG